MQNQTPNANAQYKTLVTLWAGLLMSQFMLLLVIFFARPEVFKFDFSAPLLGGENSILIIVFAVLGLTTFLISFVLESKFLNEAVERQKPELVQTALIVSCALCEATSLLGLVTVFAFSYRYFFAWFALGILGIILHFPKRDNLFAASYKK
ncbi:MAG: hypothetical protein LUM44_07235 [Pyrinomonadaceae bacterium]|nr:hypothetical protein [Pyrinomonadaceae bacterium]